MNTIYLKSYNCCLSAVKFTNDDIDYSFLDEKNPYSSARERTTENSHTIERKDPFKNLGTEYLQLKLFKQLGTYIPPEQILLGEGEEFRKKGDKMMSL